MSNFVFPSFHFYPKQLVEESKKIRKKYMHAEDGVTPERIKIMLPDLLKEIRALDNSKQTIIEYARKLKVINVNLLASEYPYEKEDQSTITKIILILMERYNRIIGRRFWRHFQQLPLDDQIVKVLRHAFRTEGDRYLALNNKIRAKYNQIFSKNQILADMAYGIGKIQKPVEESMKQWKIDRKSQLAYELWKRILYEFIAEKWFQKVQDEEVILDKLENMPFADYKLILNKYLSGFEFNEFSPKLIQQLIDRLLDPRTDMRRWEGFSESTIDKVKKWLYRADLLKFLDYERFDYWEKYIRKLEDLKIVQDPPIAAMYFKNFVVIEFAVVGNAAYFYEKDGFTKHLSSKLITYVSESELKDRDASYFIRKLNHAGDWHSRYDNYMANYLNGNFWYKHN